MKVLLMAIDGEGGAATVTGWRAELGLRAEDEITLIAWRRPAQPLPLRDVLCLGPRRQARQVADPETSRATRDVSGSPAPDVKGRRLARAAGRSLWTARTSWRFALTALTSAAARRLFARADLVVPLDPATVRAAWLMARRVPGPAVVTGVPAARSWLARHRT